MLKRDIKIIETIKIKITIPNSINSTIIRYKASHHKPEILYKNELKNKRKELQLIK